MYLTLYHFFPEKLNLYGDRGNVITMQKRCEWRGIELRVVEVRSDAPPLHEADIMLIGGGSDREQDLVTRDLEKIKDEFKSAIDDGVSCLAVCGGYQFLGEYYQLPNGDKLKGMQLFDFYTVSKPGRLTGNILMESDAFGRIVGFENHGGRTYHEYDPLGRVVKGHGNNGEDSKEGIHYKNLLGTYLHGPVLPKNPSMADYLIGQAMLRKYGTSDLMPLDDRMEESAKEKIWDNKMKEQ
ncbi:glutamine amidotransferase [Aneurinibacillus sp. Ricciae_BoGa-3]|uniref:type 1 glutamine amidotransferase n=1 Tax=Aneurinibacillus sp. Ricciae_BoGa-3 TaxID=3022697 RepID=UPI00234256F2|nr:glutamine amidotransferase [Aneurinibacillus sp. Ricciae_BoGa-3]WCK53398.1 glutamine amidotransferase [Aneurinibacillus sp. Ricciae_BoGa-3]